MQLFLFFFFVSFFKYITSKGEEILITFAAVGLFFFEYFIYYNDFHDVNYNGK